MTSPTLEATQGQMDGSFVNSHTNATSIGRHLWEIDLTFAPGLPPGWGTVAERESAQHQECHRCPDADPRDRRGCIPASLSSSDACFRISTARAALVDGSSTSSTFSGGAPPTGSSGKPPAGAPSGSSSVIRSSPTTPLDARRRSGRPVAQLGGLASAARRTGRSILGGAFSTNASAPGNPTDGMPRRTVTRATIRTRRSPIASHLC